MNKELLILKKYWGFNSFLPNQELIIKGILNRKDTVALIPTGGGKSMCFQIPALILKGVCLVVSPLIALIDDQVQRLKSLDIKAEGLHSGLSKNQQNAIIHKLLEEELRLLYISPEKLQSKKFRSILQRVNVSFIAVDEAHCISQWGYDFRPDYLKIANIRELFPEINIAAFTATANKKTLEDIVNFLNLYKPKIIRGSFLKKNLSFGLIETEKKLRILNLILNELEGSGIVYMRSRKGTVYLAELLSKNGDNVLYYHAGMDAAKRRQVQSDWIKNKARVIVSTTAFGMGIDKPDVRFVIHFDLPTSIEEYYQETGRAGRDGKHSSVLLIYNKNDLSILKKNYLDTFPTIENIELTYNNLIEFLNIDFALSKTKNIDLDDFYKYNGLNNFKTYKCISELERYGYISLNIPIRDRFSQLQIKFEPDYLDIIKSKDSKGYNVFKNAILIYENLFISSADILENKIAKRAGVDTNTVINILKKYSGSKHIVYKQQNLKFRINFLKGKHLSIDNTELIFRKNITKKNIKSVTEYLNYKKCRQKYILKYFDEKLRKTCKICDICQDVENNNYSNSEFKAFKEKINAFQFDQDTDINDLIFIDTYLRRNKNIQMLKPFFENGELAVLGNRIIKT